MQVFTLRLCAALKLRRFSRSQAPAHGLSEQPQERPSRSGIQFLCIQGPIRIRVGRIETLLDNGKVFVRRQRPIAIGIGSRQLLRAQPPGQFALVERAIMIAVQPGE